MSSERPYRASFVYPGHPVHLAIQIMTSFPSLAAAKAKGREFPAAAEDVRVSGSGGAVGQALALLSMKDELDPASLYEQGQSFWRRSRLGGDFIENLEAGEAAAAKLRSLFIARVAEWPTA